MTYYLKKFWKQNLAVILVQLVMYALTSALDQKNADIVEKSLLANTELTLILVSYHLTQERKEQFTHVYDLQPAAVC